MSKSTQRYTSAVAEGKADARRAKANGHTAKDGRKYCRFKSCKEYCGWKKGWYAEFGR